MSVNLLKPEWAQYVRNSLSVDKEVKPKLVTKNFVVDDSMLIANFAAVDARQLRASISGFYDYLLLTVETIKEFAPLQQ